MQDLAQLVLLCISTVAQKEHLHGAYATTAGICTHTAIRMPVPAAMLPTGLAS
jgi:hypothetical protein